MLYDRYIAIPTVLVVFILIGVAGPKFDPSARSVGTGAVLSGDRLSYFFLTASGPLGWSSAACDFYSYFPPQTNKWLVFVLTASGMTLGKLLIEFLGIGLGSGLSANPEWAAAFSNSGVGALITEAFEPLGGKALLWLCIISLTLLLRLWQVLRCRPRHLHRGQQYPRNLRRCFELADVWSTFCQGPTFHLEHSNRHNLHRLRHRWPGPAPDDLPELFRLDRILDHLLDRHHPRRASHLPPKVWL
jgi:hypothetical protein